jgi:hypothetical protein
MFRESAWKAYLPPSQYRVMSLPKMRPFHGGELQLATQRISAISFGLRTAMTAGQLLASCGVLHAAQDVQETYAQRQACKPDVWRLCSAFIPRRAPITDCLERNMSRLSEPCRAVFEGRLR